MIHWAGPLWGIAGLLAVLVDAIHRLAGFALLAIQGGMDAFEWTLFAGNVALMTWAEGVRGFQRRFAPRVAARALHLYRYPTPRRVLLAPLFCAGYFDATPRIMRLAWLGTGGVVVLVLTFHYLPQPWRGILDAGVVAGLGWGVASIAWYAFRSLREQREFVSAEVPARHGDSG
jgi:hypothetical protein